MANGYQEMQSDATQDLFKQNKDRNMLVPLGALATAAILGAGIRSFKRGNPQMSQFWMRARVVSQLTTVGLMLGTVYGLGKTG